MSDKEEQAKQLKFEYLSEKEVKISPFYFYNEKKCYIVPALCCLTPIPEEDARKKQTFIVKNP